MMTKVIARKLGAKEKNYIAYCEKFYFLNRGGFPTPEQAALALDYSVTEINYFLSNQTVQAALERRGLNWKRSGSSHNLTSTQIAAAVTVANFADTRPISVKLDSLGINESQYFAWLNDPEYQSFARNMANQSLENIHPEAIAAFQKLIRDGDFNAIKFYFDITGLSQSNDVMNLQSMIQMIIESVQRNVKDPTVLAAISQDLIGIHSNQTVKLELEA